MAMKFAVEAKRGKDVFRFRVEDIIVDHAENNRVTVRSEEETKATALSILKNGQLQPCRVRRLTDSLKVQLVSGYGRYLAVTYINEVIKPEKPVLLECICTELSPEAAYVEGLVENIDRAELTPLDRAHAARKLEDVYGWEKKRVAELFKQSVANISRMRKATTLSTPIQDEIKNGNLTLGAAIPLTEVPEAEREAIVEEARDSETGRIEPEKVRKRVREVKQKQESPAQTQTARSMKEVREFLESNTGPGEKDGVRSLCQELLRYIAGEITDEDMTGVLQRCCKE
jgi:ParB family chromosome partitioning protein